MAYLLVEDSNGDRTRIEIPPGVVLVGRGAEADVRIVDRSVSKRHAEIAALPNARFRLTDLGSSNGMFVERRRERDVVIEAGTSFRLGHVTCVIGGVGEETFPIPDSIPRPGTDESSSARSGRGGDGSARELWSRRERRIALLVLAGLAVAVAAAWGLRQPSPGDRDSEGTSSVGSLQTETDSSGAAPSSEVASLEESERSELAWFEGWRRIGHALDQECSGCHLEQPRVRFLKDAPRAQPGRWEENLRWVRADLVVNEGTLSLRELGAAPHDRLLPVIEAAEIGIDLELLLSAPTQLFPPPLPFTSEWSSWDSPESRAYRRTMLTFLGRVPTMAELLASLESSRDRWRPAMIAQPGAWRWQARQLLRGGTRYPEIGAFLLPADLGGGSDSPEAWKKWVSTLRDDGAVASSRPIQTPLELEDQVLPSQGALTADSVLFSAATMVWGRAPTNEEANLLWEALVQGRQLGLSSREVVEGTLNLLLFSPANRYPAPPSSPTVWLEATARAITGVGWTKKEIEVLNSQLPRVDFRQILRVLWLDQLAPTEEPVAATTAPESRPSLRLEVWSSSSLSNLFTDPERTPHWWSRMERAHLHWYPAESVTLKQRFQELAVAAAKAGDLLVVDGRVAGDQWPSHARILRADGSLLPAWRDLVDRVGTPRSVVTLDQDESLRRELGRPTARAEVRSLAALSRAGRGYLTTTSTVRSLGAAWLRTLELAREAMRRESRVSAWFTLTADPESEPDRWEVFSTFLENSLGEIDLDVWFWWAEGDRLRCLRVGFGPEINRGWVQHEEQSVVRLHPVLSKASLGVEPSVRPEPKLEAK